MNFPQKADHLLFLNKERCVGCTHCIRSCPTEAIRIRRGKAEFMVHRCIRCGECIRVCPRQSWGINSNSYEKSKKVRKGAAILDPAAFWQFGIEINPGRLIAAFLELGFTAVQDLGEAFHTYGSAVSFYLASQEKATPSIASTCPTVVQLVQVKYPSLIENLVPIIPPYQMMAQNWKKRVSGESVPGLYYIVPCLAQAEKVQELHPPEGMVIEAIPLLDLYNPLKAVTLQQRESLDGFPWTETAISGMKWAAAGGESRGMGISKALVVDGIHNVARILELAENGLLNEVEFIEAWACPGGCLGGPLTVQNPFFAKYQLEEWLKRTENRIGQKGNKVASDLRRWNWEKSLSPRPGMRLDEDLKKAIEKLGRLDEIAKHFPGIDCGACGCPTCLAFAEDVVQGYAREKECLYLMRKKIQNPKQNLRKK